MTEAVKRVVSEKLTDVALAAMSQHINRLIEEFFKGEPDELKDEMYKIVRTNVKNRV